MACSAKVLLAAALVALGLCTAPCLAQTNKGLSVGETHPQGKTEKDAAGAIWDYIQVREVYSALRLSHAQARFRPCFGLHIVDRDQSLY